jgi:RNA polymerase sigma-70 factor (ECF subfamily)
MTLDHHIADDLCQETMVALLESITRLKISSTKQFWAWLYRTALGKIQKHHCCQGNKRIRRRTLVDTDRLQEVALDTKVSGLNRLVREELVHAISHAMRALKINHRNVLTLRCFEGLSYREIAQIRGGTQLQAKVMFFRAKQALKRQLRHIGFNESYLLPALTLFASITAGLRQQAAASVTKACLMTGPLTGLTAVLTSTSSIALVTGVIITGSVTTSVMYSRQQETAPTYVLMQDEHFVFPSFIIASSNPQDWLVTNAFNKQVPHMPTQPEAVLTQQTYEYGRCLLLPEGSWVEVGYSGPLVDGPGPDLFFSGWGCRALRVSVTDGAGRIYALPTPVCIHNPYMYHVVSFDLSEHDIPFEARAIRVYGHQADIPPYAFQLQAVKARIAGE